MIRAAFAIALSLIATTAFAQPPGPYAGLENRTIKALSDQQIADLRAGRGMSLALAAELNGYPGPLHLIENAKALALSPGQLARVQRLYAEMKAEAVPLGERLIAQEIALDRLFATRTVTADNLMQATAAIGQTQAELRATHLRYHLLTVGVLTGDQLQSYTKIRGYDGSKHVPMRHRPH